MNLTNFRVYSQTCVQRSLLGNGKVTLLYRVTAIYRAVIQRFDYIFKSILHPSLFLFWLNFAAGINVGQSSFEDSSVPSFFLSRKCSRPFCSLPPQSRAHTTIYKLSSTLSICIFHIQVSKKIVISASVMIRLSRNRTRARGRGEIQKVLNGVGGGGGRLLPGVQPFTLLYTFLPRKVTAFVYILLTDGTPFSYLVQNFASLLIAVNTLSLSFKYEKVTKP